MGKPLRYPAGRPSAATEARRNSASGQINKGDHHYRGDQQDSLAADPETQRSRDG